MYSFNLVNFKCLFLYQYIFARDHGPCFSHVFNFNDLKERNSYIVVGHGYSSAAKSLDYFFNLVNFNRLCISTYLFAIMDHLFSHVFNFDNFKERNSYFVVFDNILICLLSVDVPFEFGSGFGSFRCAVHLNFVSNMVARETARNNRTFVRQICKRINPRLVLFSKLVSFRCTVVQLYIYKYLFGSGFGSF